jgi:ABC-type sugar transport system ATPase subunit
MIELKNITFAYNNGKTVLSNLNFYVERRSIVCLLGSSGSGKTSILRLIAGLEVPLQGQILIDNQLVSNNKKILVPPHKRNISYIFQDLALWPHMTVFQNLAFVLKAKKVADYETKVWQMLEFLDIENLATKYPHQLSGGQQQLVAIGRALVVRPKILLMDEPLANLDLRLRKKILDLVKNLRQEFGLTVIYVTHDYREAFYIGDKIALLEQGRITFYDEPKKLADLKSDYFVGL